MLKKRKERYRYTPTFTRNPGEVRLKIKKIEFPHFIGEVML